MTTPDLRPGCTLCRRRFTLSLDFKAEGQDAYWRQLACEDNPATGKHTAPLLEDHPDLQRGPAAAGGSLFDLMGHA